MNQDFYHRERQVKQYEERQRAKAEKHQTLETVQIEQNAALDGIESPVGEKQNAGQGVLARLKKAIFGK
ncbi:MAG TPA: hypothetical protein VK003_11120 [Oceanobacillus sp.]|nr:hypothetical protein [Oceanobacillus sp.]